MATRRDEKRVGKKFLRDVDAWLVAFYRKLASPKNLHAVRIELERWLDCVTEWKQPGGQILVEANRLLNSDWRDTRRLPIGCEISAISLAYLATYPELLSGDQHSALEQVLVKLVLFARRAKTPAIARIDGEEIRGAIEAYSAFRGLDLAKKRKRRGRPAETGRAADDARLVADWKASGLPKKEFCHGRALNYDAVDKAQRRLRARKSHQTRIVSCGKKSRAKILVK